ncbi:hypothetical protein R1flu_022153 [Riccia fluitans]|uniref:non-specific serine/threonine protein kinase n=1 Tax=Riccia fluitans TaxID=41844 RepID=A0ABD1ZRQ5_9MARC
MGNKLARNTQVSPNEYYLQDLPTTYNLVLKEVLGQERMFKTVQCVHDDGLLVVKVYFKRGETGSKLKEHAARLEYIKQELKDVEHSHVLPFRSWVETDKAAYLLRQYLFSNLHDRISTRPFLSLMEKKWIAFQLLYAVKQCHEKGVCHGDIKCENVLVTSWNWVYLADFASFKPTYLPVDFSGDFSFFFDTGGRRRCYVAPERFYDPKLDSGVKPESSLEPAMDTFSVGCVIAELFLEGQTLFDLSQLLAYRKGQYDPGPSLDKIPDEKIKTIVQHMLQLSPEARATPDEYLQSWAPTVFPTYFTPLLHKFFSCLVPLDADTRVAATQKAFPEIRKQMIADTIYAGRDSSEGQLTVEDQSVVQNVRNVVADEVEAVADGNALIGLGSKVTKVSPTKYIVDGVLHRVKAAAVAMSQKRNPMMEHDEEILNNKWESNEVLSGDSSGEVNVLNPEGASRKKGMSVSSEQDSTKGEATVLQQAKCEGMVLIASLLCACVRNVRLPQYRRGAIQLLHEASRYCDDDARLQHILPYVVALLADKTAIVRCAALQTLCYVLSMVQTFPPSDAKIFPEYILPLLAILPDDPEESVRIAYANNIHKIARASYRFLVRSQHGAEAGEILDNPGRKEKGGVTAQPPDGELSLLRETVARVIQELVMGPKQTPTIRRALLQHVGSLCHFFGPKQSNDFLLPVLPAFLNDRDEQLRAVFFEYIVHVCLFVGQASVEAYLLPYIEQALNDVEETVIVNALECLAALCKQKLLRKRILLVAVERACPLLCHPSHWVRRAAVTFIAASSASLDVVDSHAFLTPILLPLLRREPASLSSESSILVCLKPPVSREVLQRALSNVQTTPATESGKAKSKGKQRIALIQPPPDQEGCQPPRSSYVERREKTDIAVDPNEGRPKSSSGRKAASSPSSPRVFQAALNVDNEDGEKMKAMEAYLRNLSSNLQSRMHMEAESAERLDSAAVGLPPGVGAGYYSHYDGSVEGIPLYTYQLPLAVERKSEDTVSNQANFVPPGSASYNEDWSRIFDGRHGGPPFPMGPVAGSFGPASSQWANIPAPSGEPMQRSMASVPVVPRFMAGSVYHAGPVAGRRRVVNELARDGRTTEPASMINHGPGVSKSNVAASADTGLETSPGMDPVIEVYPSVDSVTAMLGSIHLGGQSPVEGTWRPKGVLIANLQEHQRSVNQIAVAHDNTFFVSGSDDGNVKVWDCRRLERDRSEKSRLTYSFGSKAPVLCVTTLASSHEVVAATSTGKIHKFNVDYVAKLNGSNERYKGFTEICKMDSEKGAVLSLQTFKSKGPSLLLYSTQRNGMHLTDVRTQSEAWVLKGKAADGYITTTALDPNCNWVVSGTSRGIMTLWDLRFLIPVNTWEHPLGCPIESMCPLLPTPNLDRPSVARPFVYVAAGLDEIALWNAEDGKCHQVMRLASEADAERSAVPSAISSRGSDSRVGSSSTGTGSQLSSLKLNNYRIDELNDPPQRLRGVRALFPLAGGSGLLSAGSDCRIRMWDRVRPDRSYTVCGPNTKASAPENTVFEISSHSSVRIIQESFGVENGRNQAQGSKSPAKSGLAAAALDCVGCHRDCIRSLAFAQASQRYLISSSRDGVIKVWK